MQPENDIDISLFLNSGVKQQSYSRRLQRDPIVTNLMKSQPRQSEVQLRDLMDLSPFPAKMD